MGGFKGKTRFNDAKWNSHFKQFECKRKFDSHEIQFIFDTYESESLENLARLQPTADRIWMAHGTWFRKFRDYVSTNCLKQFNILLSQEEPPLNVTQRQIRKSLICPYMITIRSFNDSEEIRIDFNGGGHQWGSDDNRLKDYMVEANATLSGGFDDAHIFIF